MNTKKDKLPPNDQTVRTLGALGVMGKDLVSQSIRLEEEKKKRNKKLNQND